MIINLRALGYGPNCRGRFEANDRVYIEGINAMISESTITCPKCAHKSLERMPTDACQFFYDCKECGERLKPLTGDCCVFCSYGDVPCPPIQEGVSCHRP
jgi:hypothetical protein